MNELAIITRRDLVSLLDQEGYSDAANAIIAGAHPAETLNMLRPFIAYENDEASYARIKTLRYVCEGWIGVV